MKQLMIILGMAALLAFMPMAGEQVAAQIVFPIDHFKCYDVSLAPGEVFGQLTITLEDQFGTQRAVVKKPNRLCTPVDKDGGGIQSPAGHLVCYPLDKAEGEPNLERKDVSIDNQFGPLLLIVNDDPRWLCVPSKKEEIIE